MAALPYRQVKANLAPSLSPTTGKTNDAFCAAASNAPVATTLRKDKAHCTNLGRRGATMLALGAFCAVLAFSATGCASVATASNTGLNTATPVQQLAAASNEATDRSSEYIPDVSNSSTVSRIIYIDGDTAWEGTQEDIAQSDAQSSSATASNTNTSATNTASSAATSSAYTVEIAIDPYTQLWDAKGTITDINYQEKTISVRLTTYDMGHFSCQDVLLTYGNNLSFNEFSMHKDSVISFQYLLTNPMRSPVQAYNIKLLS